MDNYRGICLLQITSRLIARIGGRRLTKHLEEKGILATEQWGFKPNRSSTDAVFVMARIAADAAGQLDPNPVVMDMMDIKKAYPNCSRNAMDGALKAVGVPDKMRTLLMKLDSQTQYRCRTKAGVSEPYMNNRGTREGCPAAPVKFNVLHHVATMKVREAWAQEGLNGSVKIAGLKQEDSLTSSGLIARSQIIKAQAECSNEIDVVGYADDTTIIGRKNDAEAKRKVVKRVYTEWGHQIHPDKWQKVMLGRNPDPRKRCKIKGKQPEPAAVTTEAKALGCYIEADSNYTKEAGARISKASMIWQRLKKKLSKAPVSLKTKGNMFRASVVASMLYGVEALGPPAKLVKKMQTAVNGWERQLYFGPKGGSTKDMVGKITQAEIKQKLGTISIQLEIDIRLGRYIGHIARMPEERWEKDCYWEGWIPHLERSDQRKVRTHGGTKQAKC